MKLLQRTCICYVQIKLDLDILKENEKGESNSQLLTDYTRMCARKMGDK